MEQQPIRKGTPRPPREFDQTQLHDRVHGAYVHRDYAAHFFRWVTVREAVGRDDRVLDIGCGQDQPLQRLLTASLSHLPARYVGVDLNPIAEKLRTPWGMVYDRFNFIARWEELAAHGPYTVATCFEVIEHMDVDNGRKLLKAVLELLAPDGTFYLSTPVFDGRAAKNHVHEYEVAELQALVTEAGWQTAARYGTFGNVNALKKVLTPEERMLWTKWEGRLGNEGLSVVFATDHPDQCRNNLWVLKKRGEDEIPNKTLTVEEQR